jgi:hypothetical protein
MDWLITNLGSLLDVATKVVAVAAAIAALVPSGGNAVGVIASVRKVIDVLALNIGNAKNAESSE